MVEKYGQSNEKHSLTTKKYFPSKGEKMPGPLKALPIANRWQDMAEAFAEHISLEMIARAKRIYEPMLVPGLLQTAAYTRSLALGNDLDLSSDFEDGEPDLESAADLRRDRQRRLTSSNPLRLHAIMDENVVRRQVGGPAVMAEQLRHMVSMSALAHIVLQIIPISHGAYTGMESAGFSVLEFEPGTREQDFACFYEGAIGAVWAECEEDRDRTLQQLDCLEKLALSPENSRKFMASIAQEMAVLQS